MNAPARTPFQESLDDFLRTVEENTPPPATRSALLADLRDPWVARPPAPGLGDHEFGGRPRTLTRAHRRRGRLGRYLHRHREACVRATAVTALLTYVFTVAVTLGQMLPSATAAAILIAAAAAELAALLAVTLWARRA